MDFEIFQKTRYFRSLNGLRALSIIAVVWHHTTSSHGTMLSRGFLGVDLFFVISGFLIVTLLLRERDATRTISLPNFYVRRALRILPPYLLMVSIVAVMKQASTTDLLVTLAFISNLIAVQGLLSITWSLSVEEQFYAVIPALIKHFGSAFPYVVAALYASTILVPLGLLPSPTPFFRETTFGPIILGAALGWILNTENGYLVLARLLHFKAAAALAFVATIALIFIPASDISGWLRIGIQWAMTALVASCVISESNSLAPFLKFSPLSRLGHVSYGIYLFHLLAAHVSMKIISVVSFYHFALTLCLSWIIAEVSYRWYERPLLAFKPLSPATSDHYRSTPGRYRA